MIYVNARRVGIDPELFWDLTPCELLWELDAAKLRRNDAHDLVVMGAWYAEAIKQMTRRDKRVPDLKKLLARSTDPQTIREEQEQAYKRLSDDYGLKMRYVKKG